MKQRIRQGLEAGHSILVLADGPLGVPSHLSRFRLDSFHAAAETGAPLQPVGVLGTSHILEPVRRAEPRAEARILVGQPIRLAERNGNGLAGARELVRGALAELCDKK